MTSQPEMTTFESFQIGQESRFGSYPVTEAEILEFARKYDPQFFHLDPEAAKHSLFGGLCASGWHTCAMTMAMLVEQMKGKGASLGSPGVDELRWLKPVYPGETLSVQTVVTDLIPSKSRPTVGLVVQKVTVVNQDMTPVMSFISKGFFARADKTKFLRPM